MPSPSSLADLPSCAPTNHLGLCLRAFALPSRVSAFPALPQDAAHSPDLDLIQLIRLVPAMTSEVIFCLLAFSLRTDALPVLSSGNPQHLQQCLTHSRCLVNTNPLAGGRAGAAVWVLGLSAQDGKGNEMGRNKPLVGAGAPAWAGWRAQVPYLPTYDPKGWTRTTRTPRSCFP